MRKKNQRTLRADGDKIRRLRSATGKTQKELLRGSTVGMRTYQRAEQGLAVSPDILREVAALFQRPLADVVSKRDGDQGSFRGNTLRLHPCDGKGGMRILRELQHPGDLRFQFDVDPYGATASLIADVVRFCKMNHYAGDQADLLQDDEFIEAVGELNSKIAELYGLGVNVHYASFVRWETKRDTLGDGQLIRVPNCMSCLEIMFSERSDIIQRPMREWETYERVCSSCHDSNFGHRVSPEQLSAYVEAEDGPFADRVFMASYKKYFHERIVKVLERDDESDPEKTLLLIEKAD